MKQLCERTGLSRQAIHFYIKKGLVRPGIKGGKTSAEYTDEHIDRILLIRRMREEQFLPLEVIRATLDSRDKGFSAAQRQLLAEVRKKFGSPESQARQLPTLGLKTVSNRTGVAQGEVEELLESGLLRGHKDADGGWRIQRDDLWLVESWAELSGLGLGSAEGFRPRQLEMFRVCLETLVKAEAALLSTMLAGLRPEKISDIVERSLPATAKLLAGFHERAIRAFLEEL